MKTLITIAWRNIWRHPARSGVLIAAVVVGLWAGVVTVGTVNGLMQQRVDYLIDSEIAHAQIHHPEFLAEGYSWLYIPDHEEILNWLDEDPRIAVWSARTMTDGMVQSPIKTSGVRIRGIDIDQENRTTDFHENMVEGEYLDSDVRNAVIVGRSLARDHNLRIGNRIVLVFEDTGNELASGSFNIVGFFESASTEFDDRNVFVRSGDFSRYLAEEPVVHEIAMRFTELDMAAAVVADINTAFSRVEAQTWRELSPELNVLVELGGVMHFVMTMIIMLALAFGILNTMLMALFERMREIGMLLSIGMSKMRVFSMILLESIILTLSGALTGILLAWISINYLSGRGINLEQFAAGVAELGWDHIIYPVISIPEYAGIVTLVMVITLLASVYPALKAIRINPLEAAKDA
jgi:ABC-type lipoprotein release transport system permease subunit